MPKRTPVTSSWNRKAHAAMVELQRFIRKTGVRAFARAANLPHTTVYKFTRYTSIDQPSYYLFALVDGTRRRLSTRRPRREGNRSPTQTPNTPTASA